MKNDESDSRPIILIIDDEADFLDALRLFLLADGNQEYQIVTASNPFKIGKVISTQAEQIRMIIVDFHMPELNGIEVLKWVRALPELERIPILMLSGDHTGRRKVAEFGDPNIDFLLKPFDPEVLFYRVKRSGEFI
jgi:putative two-component system response regulator